MDESTSLSALKLSADKLRQMQRRQSLGALTPGVAHFLNNMLMVIGGNADVALDSLSDDDPTRHYLQQIQTAVGRTADCCRQLLACANKDAEEPFNLSELVDEMAPLLEVCIGRKAELHMKLADGVPTLMGGAAGVRQLLLNLVANAANAIDKAGGRIEIETGVVPPDESDARERRVFLRVRDSGCGIANGVIDRIFEPFFTTREGECGLGLTAAREIARALNGDIRVESRAGEGSTFTVVLPAP